jgi:hypothetical protein
MVGRAVDGHLLYSHVVEVLRKADIGRPLTRRSILEIPQVPALMR